MSPELEKLARILPRTRGVIAFFERRPAPFLVRPSSAAQELAETLGQSLEDVQAALRDLRPHLTKTPAAAGCEWWVLNSVTIDPIPPMLWRTWATCWSVSHPWEVLVVRSLEDGWATGRTLEDLAKRLAQHAFPGEASVVESMVRDLHTHNLLWCDGETWRLRVVP